MHPKSRNIVFHHGQIARADRERLLGQRGCVLWFTGLSGSGKSTVAREVERQLFERSHLVHVLDGDNVRHGLNRDLGFSDDDRKENIRRIAEVATLSVDVGLIVLTAFISPFRADRAAARAVIGSSFLEVFVDTPIEECERRDPKGLYKKARAGQIPEFTGITSPYEAPIDAELTLHTAGLSVAESAKLVIDHLDQHGYLSAPPATSAGTP